jgi:hypothetical protein
MILSELGEIDFCPDQGFLIIIPIEILMREEITLFFASENSFCRTDSFSFQMDIFEKWMTEQV